MGSKTASDKRETLFFPRARAAPRPKNASQPPYPLIYWRMARVPNAQLMRPGLRSFGFDLRLSIAGLD